MAIERKKEPKLAEAAARTTAALESLRSRLNREGLPVESALEPPAPDDLEAQLERYFASPPPQPAAAPSDAPILGEIRAQVVDGVVDRILRSWGEPSGQLSANIRSEVIARLVEYVLADLLKKGAASR
jgi:hypothetical protein